MATGNRLDRLRPYVGRPWLIGLLVIGVVVAVIRLAPEQMPEPPLQLVALGPDGAFRDTLVVPERWGDTATTAGGVVRVPLVLGVRNTGERPGRPTRLSLSLPARYRLAGPDGGLEAQLTAGSPLITYAVPTELGPVAPGRMPTLLPSLDTLWLEVLIPSYYCVILADSVPEFIPAPAPPVATLSDVRVFYSFEGGNLTQRRTGTLTIWLDSALLDVPAPAARPSVPVAEDTALATPETGTLRFGGTRQSSCGDAQNPIELRSTLWLGPDGGRVLSLAHGGTEWKRLYDLDGDGVIERESWDADRDGVFEATRAARLPTPESLLPIEPPDGPAPDSIPVPR